MSGGPGGPGDSGSGRGVSAAGAGGEGRRAAAAAMAAEAAAVYDQQAHVYDRHLTPRKRRRFEIIEAPMLAATRGADRVLDLGCGVGRLLPRSHGRQTIGMDLSRGMLRRAADAGYPLVAADAHGLPFKGGAFDAVIAACGVFRYLPWCEASPESSRVLAPGGVLLVLEFSKPESPMLESAYSVFQSLWPGLGKLVVGDAGSYQYLVESIRMHPPQKALKLMLEDAGFVQCEYHNMTGGIVALHKGVKA